MKIEAMDDLGLCCRVVEDEVDEQKEIEPVLYFSSHGYVTRIVWPQDYTEEQKGCFVAYALKNMAEIIKINSERPEATTPEEDEERYDAVMCAMRACYGILDNFKIQIARPEEVTKAGDK